MGGIEISQSRKSLRATSRWCTTKGNGFETMGELQPAKEKQKERLEKKKRKNPVDDETQGSRQRHCRNKTKDKTDNRLSHKELTWP